MVCPKPVHKALYYYICTKNLMLRLGCFWSDPSLLSLLLICIFGFSHFPVHICFYSLSTDISVFFLHWTAVFFSKKASLPIKQNINVYIFFYLQIVISSKPKIQQQFQPISVEWAGITGVCWCIIAKSSKAYKCCLMRTYRQLPTYVSNQETSLQLAFWWVFAFRDVWQIKDCL